MPEEPITQPATQPEEIHSDISEAEKRIKQLSEKVRLTAEERDEKDTLIKERDVKIAELEKENAFNSGFSDMLTNYPNATMHKDDIKQKVLSGYSVEDATLAVLGKAGKLGTPAPAPQVAGGSADTAMPDNATKSLGNMTTEEKRAILEKELLLA